MTYHLTIECENEIVSNLAFLSATIDNILKVIAICIEEDDSSKVVKV